MPVVRAVVRARADECAQQVENCAILQQNPQTNRYISVLFGEMTNFFVKDKCA